MGWLSDGPWHVPPVCVYASQCAPHQRCAATWRGPSCRPVLHPCTSQQRPVLCKPKAPSGPLLQSKITCYGLANPSVATHAALKSKSKADAQANTLQALDAWRMRRGSLRECACPNAAACTGACARTNGGRGTGLDNAERQWVPANIRRPRTHFYTDAHANAPTYGRAVTRPALPGVKVEPR